MKFDILELLRQKESEISTLRERLAAAQSDMAALQRTLELIGYQGGANTTELKQPSLTVGDAVFRVLSDTSKPLHADDILNKIAVYGVTSSKATIVSQMLRDARFIKVGKNVFRLRQSTDVSTHDNENTELDRQLDDKKPTMAEVALGVLRDIGHPVTTSELRDRLVERGLYKADRNLFPKLHTALKRKDNEVRLSSSNKWILQEWINTTDAVDFTGVDAH